MVALPTAGFFLHQIGYLFGYMSLNFDSRSFLLFNLKQWLVVMFIQNGGEDLFYFLILILLKLLFRHILRIRTSEVLKTGFSGMEAIC